MNTTNLLLEIGLSENEATLYTTLLKQGKLGYSELAKEAGLNRSSVYTVSKNLIERGLIAEDTSNPVATLIALPPKNLNTMVSKEKYALERKAELAATAVSQLQTLAESATYPLPQTILVTSENINKYFYDSTKRWNTDALTTDNTWWGYQDPSFLELYGDWVNWFWKQPFSKGVETKLFSHESTIEQHIRSVTPDSRTIRILPDMTFTGTQWIVGNSIILLNTTSEKHYLTEIIDPILAANTRAIFRKLWEDYPCQSADSAPIVG